MTLQELLDKVEKLDREAAPGPWVSSGNSVYLHDGEFFCEAYLAADNAFIAQSRQLLPLLAKIVKELTTDERFDDPDLRAMIETAEEIINKENAI